MTMTRDDPGLQGTAARPASRAAGAPAGGKVIRDQLVAYASMITFLYKDVGRG
jgi:hypothetical protein